MKYTPLYFFVEVIEMLNGKERKERKDALIRELVKEYRIDKKNAREGLRAGTIGEVECNLRIDAAQRAMVNLFSMAAALDD